MSFFLLAMAATACTGNQEQLVLKVGGIPDQDTSRLARRYQVFSDYLSRQLGVPVKYTPSVDYAAVVTAFTPVSYTHQTLPTKAYE